LRYQDYQQGRKTASAYGQTTFGAPAAQPSTGIFGQPAAATQPTTSLFGGFGTNNAATTGTNATTYVCGMSAQLSVGAPAQPAAGGGLFGGGTFGQQQQQQQPQQSNAFGTFGQPQQQQQQPQQSSGGLFGGAAFGTQSQQPKPFGTFGQSLFLYSTASYLLFSKVPPIQPVPSVAQGMHLDSRLHSQQQPQAVVCLGRNNSSRSRLPMHLVHLVSGLSLPYTLMLIYHQEQTQTHQSRRCLANKYSRRMHLAGLEHRHSRTSPLSQVFSLQEAYLVRPVACSGRIRSNRTSSLNNRLLLDVSALLLWPLANNLHCVVFGTQPTTQPANGGLFGNTTGGSLFGNNTAQQQPQQQQQQQQPSTGFSLFNKPPATTGNNLFGGGFGQTPQNNNSAPVQQSNLFGNPTGQTNSQPANNLFSGGLFSKPATTGLGTQPMQQPAGNAFGTAFAGNTTYGTSLNPAGQTLNAPQGGLTASIAQPIGANLPIFNLLPPGPRAISIDPPKKKTNLFADLQSRTTIPRLQLGYTPAMSKLRGYTSTSIPGTHGQSLGPSVSLTAGKPGVLSLSKGANNKSVLGTDAITSGSVQSPGLGSGARQSVKKLVLNRKVEPSDLFKSSKITFNPALSIAAREAEAAAASGAGRRDVTPTPASKTHLQRASGKFSAQPSADPVDQVEEGSAGELKEGDYYVRPSLSVLKQMGYAALSATDGLVVGRMGYGEIEFLETVDLTGLRRTTELLGDIVRFDDKECSVYPDTLETDKPPPGQGLNVAARITLVHCWALDKATREPIKDEKHPMAIKHLNRLKKMKKTHFESFDINEGKWVFTVDHF
jgi:nuclear pore complex protein Nup98-Nup96